MGGFEGGDEAGFWDNRRFEHHKTDLSKKVKIEPFLQIDKKLFKVLFVEDKNGIAIDPDNEKDIADKIIYLLDNSRDVQSMGKNAKKYAMKNHSLKEIVKKYKRAYETIINNN